MHASSVDPVKDILKPFSTWGDEFRNNIGTLTLLKKEVTSDDWDGVTKNDYWRGIMSDLKTKMTEWNPMLIHGLMLNKIYQLSVPRVAFVDIREPINIKAFQEHAIETKQDIQQVETIFLVSDRSTHANNFSDMSVQNMKYDIVIENLNNKIAQIKRKLSIGKKAGIKTRC